MRVKDERWDWGINDDSLGREEGKGCNARAIWGEEGIVQNCLPTVRPEEV